MTLVGMTKAGQARPARMGGPSPFKGLVSKKTSDLGQFPHTKPSLHEVANRQSKRRGEPGRNATGSPPPDYVGVASDGSPRSVLPGVL